MNDSTPAVSCRGITKEFGAGETRTLVLRDIHLEVPLSRMTMLVGPSGCGKTTLLSIIAGLLDRTSGDLQVLNANVLAQSARERILFRRKNLGFVFQQYHLLPALTAAENAAVPLVAAGVKRKEAIQRAIAVLQTLGMGQRIYNRPAQLSGGQQQRVALARALVHDPRLLICDEPTSALDARSGLAVMELLASAALRPGRAVLVVTHDQRIFTFADRIAHMADGVITEISESDTQNKHAHEYIHPPA